MYTFPTVDLTRLTAPFNAIYLPVHRKSDFLKCASKCFTLPYVIRGLLQIARLGLDLGVYVLLLFLVQKVKLCFVMWIFKSQNGKVIVDILDAIDYGAVTIHGLKNMVL